MSAEQIALMFDHLRDQVVLALKAKEEDASMIADLQQQLGSQTEKVKILEAQLQELRQVVLGLTQAEVEEEGEENPSRRELEEQTDSDAELPPPSPSQIAKILLQQVFTRLAAKGETTEDVQKSQSDDASKWEAGPGVEVEEKDNRGWKDHHEKSWSGSSDYENKVWWTADKDDLDRPKNGGWDYREKRSWSGSSDSKTSGWWMGKEQGGWNSRDPWAQWQKNQY
ncbi:msrA [Symbiodinium microadriaticum]|nr:msrA [Symbiodinium microadriaticum]